MINETLGSELKGSNIKSKTMDYVLSDVGKGNITNPSDAIMSTNMMTKDLGEDKISKITTKKEFLKGGLSDNKTLEDIAKKHDKKGYYHIKDMVSFLKKELTKGVKVEMEHTKDKSKAKEIAMDHLWENPKYYSKLKTIETKEATGASSAGGYSQPLFGNMKESKSVKQIFKKDLMKDPDYQRMKKESPIYDEHGKQIDNWGVPNVTHNDPFIKKKKYERVGKKTETKEATGSSSSGSYVTPAAWAKTTNKKDWRGKSKTQIPGGKFVQVKKKCKTFPYCNQGDINALRLTEEEILNKVISKLSNKYNISEESIIKIIKKELVNGD